jgi:Acyl transferase domain
VVNGTRATVLGGPLAELRKVVASLESVGVRARMLPVDYASHTPQVSSTEAEIVAQLPTSGRVRRASLLIHGSGTAIDTAGLTAEYWYRNLRQTVRFDTAARAMLDAGHRVFVEASPHPAQLQWVEQLAEDAEVDDVVAVGSLRRGRVLVLAGGRPPGGPEPAGGRLHDSARRRRQRVAGARGLRRAVEGEDAVPGRPLQDLRRVGRRLRPQRGMRGRRAQAAVVRAGRQRPGARDHPRVRGQPGRPQQRDHRAQRQCPAGRDPAGAGQRGLARSAGRLRGDARHGTALGIPSRCAR